MNLPDNDGKGFGIPFPRLNYGYHKVCPRIRRKPKSIS